MKHRVGYWIIGLVVLSLGGWSYWQQQQEQQRMQLALRLLDATLGRHNSGSC